MAKNERYRFQVGIQCNYKTPATISLFNSAVDSIDGKSTLILHSGNREIYLPKDLDKIADCLNTLIDCLSNEQYKEFEQRFVKVQAVREVVDGI